MRYTVQPGDTLTRVGFNVGMPYWKVELANPGRDLQNLIPGDILTIPSKNEMLPLPVVLGKLPRLAGADVVVFPADLLFSHETSGTP